MTIAHKKRAKIVDKTFCIIEKSGLYLGRLSLLLAILAYLPSIAPFTPALLISIFSFFGAMVGALSGEKRVAILTVYIVVATFLVSPICKWIEKYIALHLLVIGLIILGIFIAVMLNINYKTAKYKMGKSEE